GTGRLQGHRGYALSKAHGGARAFRDATLTQLYEGTSPTQKRVVARHLRRGDHGGAGARAGAPGAVRNLIGSPDRAAVHAGEPPRVVGRREARTSGRVSIHPWRLSDDVSGPALDDADVRRLRTAGGHQPSLQVSARAGA